MGNALDRIIGFIINKNKKIEKVFIIFIILSIICVPFVGVNYDLSKYLPEWAPSDQGLKLMESTFGYPGTARIMIGECSIYEAKHYKDEIAAVDGVDMVMWADTSANIYESSAFLQTKDLKDYYKDNYAVMDITFKYGDSDPKTHKAIDEISQILGDKGYFGGSSVQNKSLQETMLTQISFAMLMGVVMIAIILCLTTTSWFEPVMFLLIMGIAIVINMGTNIFLGTISFLTFSMASILQLAIAMDYSIFLLHTFTREKEAGFGLKEALANAIRLSVTSILSSGATTIVGFIVLALMKFTIGRDLGIVLAKGIVISLVTVLFLMPALILRWADRVERTAHKPFIPPMDGLAKVIYKMRYVFFFAILILVIPAYVAQNMNAFSYGNDAVGSSPGTKVFSDEEEINKRFGRSNLILAIVPDTDMVTERELAQELSDLKYTKSVTSLAGILPEGIPTEILPESLTSQMHTGGYARLLVPIRTAAESETAYKCTDEIRSIVKKYYPDNSYIVGVTPSTQDIQSIITKDYAFVNILSLIGVALVILFTFKSLIIPIVVMIPIEVAIFFNMALPYIFGDKMVFMGYLIVSCLQLGATVDYSILLTNNYLDARAEMEKREAAIFSISRSALSILTSGTILTIVGYGLYFISSVSAIADMGRLVGRGAVFSMALVLCMLPPLLIISDRAIFRQKKRMEKLAKQREIRKRKITEKLGIHKKKKSVSHVYKMVPKRAGGKTYYKNMHIKCKRKRSKANTGDLTQTENFLKNDTKMHGEEKEHALK